MASDKSKPRSWNNKIMLIFNHKIIILIYSCEHSRGYRFRLTTQRRRHQWSVAFDCNVRYVELQLHRIALHIALHCILPRILYYTLQLYIALHCILHCIFALQLYIALHCILHCNYTTHCIVYCMALHIALYTVSQLNWYPFCFANKFVNSGSNSIKFHRSFEW